MTKQQLREKIAELLETADWTQSEHHSWTARQEILHLIDEYEKSRLEDFVKTVFTEYDRQYQQVAGENGLQRETPFTVIHRIIEAEQRRRAGIGGKK